MKKFRIAMALACCIFAAQAEDIDGGVGYPTVAAAYAALRQDPAVQFKNDNGWLIANAPTGTDEGLWTFTPKNHPAFPSVVKRRVLSRDENTYIQMGVLCGATKEACDALVADFNSLNERLKQDLAQRKKQPQAVGAAPAQPRRQNVASTNADTSWRPSAQQLAAVEAVTNAYFAARDANKAGEAYALLAPSFQQIFPSGAFQNDVENFNKSAGTVLARRLRAVTWYKDTPRTGPGLYAAVDYAGDFSNLALYCGYVVWQEQTNGSFLQVRDEANMINKATMGNMRPGDVEKSRAQFRCID